MTKTFAIAASWMISLAGCSASATTVRKDAQGGRIALHGAYMPAMREARMLMTQRCAGRFEARELGRSVEFRCREERPLLSLVGAR